MRKYWLFPASLAALLLVAMATGCGNEPTFPTPNLEPNTRISAGPPVEFALVMQ